MSNVKGITSAQQPMPNTVEQIGRYARLIKQVQLARSPVRACLLKRSNQGRLYTRRQINIRVQRHVKFIRGRAAIATI